MAALVFKAVSLLAAPRMNNSNGNAKGNVDGDKRWRQAPDGNGFPQDVTMLPEPKGVTPYLARYSRLSQVWLNRWTILLLLVLVRTLIAIASLQADIDSSKSQALSACTGVEQVGSAMASMPHYMAVGMNELTARGVNDAVKGFNEMLLLTVTGVEELVVFVVNMMTGTYTCLITLAVSSSLHAAIQLIEDAQGFLNNTLGVIDNDLISTVDTFDSALNTFISGINSVGSLFGSGTTVPTLDLNATTQAIKDVRLPSNLDAKLQQLNNSIPTFQQVQNLTDNVIRIPFEDLKTLINNSITIHSVNSSFFPVPAKQALTFCSQNNGITNFFDDLLRISILAHTVALIVLIILAVLVCIPMGYRELRRWDTIKFRAHVLRTRAHDPLDAIYIVSRPYTSAAGLWLSEKFSSPRRKTLVRWVVAYATTVPALFVLSLGWAGLLSCLCRWVILRSVEKAVPALEQEIAGFADKVVASLENASAEWANGTNAAVLDLNDKINQNLLGWVNTSTTAVNDTLNKFVDETIGVLNSTFGGTILYQPIEGIFECLIGLKIAGIQKALTWVSDNAHVSFQSVPNDTFSTGAAASIAGNNNNSFLATQGSGGNSTNSTDAVTAVVDALINKMLKSIRVEAMISSALIGIYLLVVIFALLRALSLWFGHDPGDDLYFKGPTDLSTPPSSSDGLHDEKGILTPHSLPKPPLPPSQNPFDDTSQDQEVPIPAPYYNPSIPRSGTTQAHDFAAPHPISATAVGNTYKGQPYTLAPRPMPTLSSPSPNLTSPTTPVPHSAIGKWDGPNLSPLNENVGFAGARSIGTAMRRPPHARTSSHGEVAQVTNGLPSGPRNNVVRLGAGPAPKARPLDRTTFEGLGV